MLRLSVGATVLLLLSAAVAPAQNGKLAQVRQEMTAPADPPAPRKKDEHRPSHNCDDDNLFGQVFGPLCLQVLAAPFAVPVSLLGDPYHTQGRFLPYPYYDSWPGYLDVACRSEWDAPDPDAPPGDVFRSWAGRFAIEDSNDFDGLNRLGGRLLLEGPARLGLQANGTWLRETFDCGCTDDAFLGDANLVFRFAQNEWVQMRAGVGGRLWTDRYQTCGGFNFTYGADFFPKKPLVISSQIDAGTLGRTGVFHVRSTAGWMLRGWEAYAGYDFLRIGSVNFQGPVLGLRFWF